ncbi:hypothetical protein pb186bvf_004913 [Paramecium bursaria]
MKQLFCRAFMAEQVMNDMDHNIYSRNLSGNTKNKLKINKQIALRRQQFLIKSVLIRYKIFEVALDTINYTLKDRKARVIKPQRSETYQRYYCGKSQKMEKIYLLIQFSSNIIFQIVCHDADLVYKLRISVGR